MKSHRFRWSSESSHHVHPFRHHFPGTLEALLPHCRDFSLFRGIPGALPAPSDQRRDFVAWSSRLLQRDGKGWTWDLRHGRFVELTHPSMHPSIHQSIWVNYNDLTVLPHPGIMVRLREIMPFYGLNSG